MICIYNSTETNFNHNGLAVLKDCIKAEVTEESNGTYELDLEYPVDKEGRWLFLVEGNIIKAHTPKNGYQLFRIIKKKKISKTISLYARHVFYDLLDNFLEDCRPTNINGAGAIQWILSGTQYPHNFTGISDISVNSSASYIRKNPVNALIGDDENSFVKRWGGEIERDNFTVKMLSSTGSERGSVISYGKNLIGFEESTDYSKVITRLMLTGLYENDTVLKLPEVYIDSQYINNYLTPKIKHIHYTDFRVNSEEGITEEMVIEMLRNEAVRLFNEDHIDIPDITYTVSFEDLSKTEQYKDLTILETMYINDIIPIKHSKLEINITQKIVKYTYNALTKKYKEMQLGNLKQSFANSINKTVSDINKISKDVENTKSSFQEALDKATDTITGSRGGHFIIRTKDNPQETLWMDTDDVNTAQRVLRINKDGIGFSKTGINGPYTSAWTIDDILDMSQINVININASAINTGYMNARHLAVFGEQSLNDFFRVQMNDEGKIEISIGAEGSEIILRQVNDRIGFYDTADNVISYWSNNSFEMENLAKFRIQNFAFLPRTNGNLTFTKVVE